MTPTDLPEPEPRRRLDPAERRQQILDAARTLFAERPFSAVTTADVAEAAGVARSLVHHYFGGIRELFLAVAAQGGAALADVRTAGPETPLDERVAHNIAASLDTIAANRETWLAVVGHGSAPGDEGINGIVEATIRLGVERALTVNADLVRDTAVARLAFRAFQAFSTAAIREWLTGDTTRQELEALLSTALRHLVLDTLPEVERALE